MSAALVYEGLPVEARAAWLDALDVDVPAMGLPRAAAYAPLFAVEVEPELRARIALAMGPLTEARSPRAFVGARADGVTMVAIALPIYLDFVELLVANVVPDALVASVAFESMVVAPPDEAGARLVVDGHELRPEPMDDAIELLAHAVVATRRSGAPIPEGMHRFADLFTPRCAAGV